MSPLRITYLILAVLGALWPMRFFLAWLSENSWSLGGMFAAWGTNNATSGLTADLILSAIALTIWIIAETRIRKNWTAFWAIPATFLIGVSCGLPLYLFLRTRKVT